MHRPKHKPHQRNHIPTHAHRALQIPLQHRPANRKHHTRDKEKQQREQPHALQHPALDEVHAPADTRPSLRADDEFLFTLLGRAQEGDGFLVVGVFGVVEEVSHQVLADGRDEVDGLVRVVVFPAFRGQVGDFADVDVVFDVEFELQGRLAMSKDALFGGPKGMGDGWIGYLPARI